MAMRSLIYSEQDFVDFIGHLEDLLDIYLTDDRWDDAEIVREYIAQLEDFLEAEEGEPGFDSLQAQGRLHFLRNWYNNVFSGNRALSATSMRPTGSGYFHVMPAPTVRYL